MKTQASLQARYKLKNAYAIYYIKRAYLVTPAKTFAAHA